MSGGIKPIALSFKKTEEDTELYKWIISHSNMSGFIKDTLRAAMNEKVTTEIKTNAGTESNNLIEFDF